MNDKKPMSAIFYVLRTGCFKNGERLMYSNVCGLMVYRYMIKRLGLTGNGNRWMVLLQRHLLGEKGTGPNPTDRAKCGTKRSVLVDGKGVPLGVVVSGANKHDMKLTKTTLQNVVIDKPEPTIKSKQHICLDRGYDYPEVYELLQDWLYNSYQITMRRKKQ
jgi:putative transposase